MKDNHLLPITFSTDALYLRVAAQAVLPLHLFRTVHPPHLVSKEGRPSDRWQIESGEGQSLEKERGTEREWEMNCG